jgi:alpha-L-fucosidase
MDLSRQPYEPTWESLNRHAVPRWFRDAKLGIFIHWGVFSVPGWAPPHDKNGHFYDEPIGSIPYAELYGAGLRYKGSPVWNYHVEHYGADFQYEDFIPMFTAAQWDPDAWARLFASVNARYVCLVSRHSDDFCLWPTQQSQRNAFVQGPQRDLVGDLTAAVRAQHLKMGLYYSLTFDLYHDRYPHKPYVDYAHKQVKELVDNYSPDLLWSDDYWKPYEKSMASTWNSKDLIAYFYNHAADPAEVLVNDRWGREENGLQLGDYATPEYASIRTVPPFVWEMTRGIGASYGYNRAEGEAEYLSVDELVTLFVDVVSKNGNLLLNVGPTAEGLIAPLQEQRLRGLGAWLDVNGEAIFASRPWVVSEGWTRSDCPVRFTTRDGALYAIVFGETAAEVVLRGMRAVPGLAVRLLGTEAGDLPWTQGEDGLHVQVPSGRTQPAFTFKLSPQPYALLRLSDGVELSQAETWRRAGPLYIR